MEQYSRSPNHSLFDLGISDEDFGLLLPQKAKDRGKANQSSHSAWPGLSFDQTFRSKKLDNLAIHKLFQLKCQNDLAFMIKKLVKLTAGYQSLPKCFYWIKHYCGAIFWPFASRVCKKVYGHWHECRRLLQNLLLLEHIHGLLSHHCKLYFSNLPYHIHQNDQICNSYDRRGTTDLYIPLRWIIHHNCHLSPLHQWKIIHKSCL